MKSGLGRHTVLDIPQRLIQLCFIIWPVKIEDTVCLLIYCDKVLVLSAIESGLSRHTAITIPQRLIQLCFIVWPVKKIRHCGLATLLC